MSTAVIIGIVVLLGGIVGVFLYLRAQKRKETERKRQEEAERRRQEEAARKAKEEAKEAAKEAKEKSEQRIRALKTKASAELARLERSAREAEKRRMKRREEERRERQERQEREEKQRRERDMRRRREREREEKEYQERTRKRRERELQLRKRGERARYQPRPVRLDKGPPRRFGGWKRPQNSSQWRRRRLVRRGQFRPVRKKFLHSPRRCHPTFGCPKPERWRKCPPGKLCRVRRFGNRSRFGGSPFCRQANPYARKNCERARRRRGRGF